MKISIQNTNIYYEVQGQGQPWVLLHGWGSSSNHLRPIANLMKENLPCKIYNLDFPGFGYSDSPDSTWSVNNYKDFLLAFLDHFELETVNLLGHSFGGRVAIKFAAAHPQRLRRMVLVDSAGILPSRSLAYYFKVMAAKTLRVLKKGLGKNFARSLDSHLGSEDYRQAGKMRSTLVKVVNEDLRPCLPQIQAPTLLIWGENDRSTPLSDAKIMQAEIPSSRLEVIPLAGHFCFVDNFSAFKQILLPFAGEDQ